MIHQVQWKGLVVASLVRGSTAGTASTAGLPLQSQTLSPLPLVLLDLCDSLFLGNDNILGSYSRKNGGGLSGILAPSTDLVAVFPEEEWERNASQRQKGGNGTRPVDTQVLVHVSGEERESGTKERSENGASSQSRGGEDNI